MKRNAYLRLTARVGRWCGAVLTAAAVWNLPARAADAPATTRSNLAEVTEALRARGEPTRLEDLAPAPVPDDQNAALLLRQATEELDEENAGPRSGADDFPDLPPFPRSWQEQAKANAQENLRAHTLAREARSRKQVAWASPPSHPIEQWLQASLSDMNGYRTLANSLADQATYTHVHGNDFEAIQTLLDLQFLADMFSHRPLLISYLVSCGIWALDAQAVQTIAPNLNPPDVKAQAPRDLVAQAIAGLLDDTKVKVAARRALRGKRVLVLEQAREGKWPVGWIGGIVDQIDQALADVDRPAGRRAATIPADDGLARLLGASMMRINETTDRILLDRHVAAISLAMALYRADHDGHWPDQLEQLVPNYLAALPVDPSSPTGAPPRYERLNDGQRPMVRSVGPDGQADPLETAPTKGSYGWQARPSGADDQWRDLSAWHGG